MEEIKEQIIELLQENTWDSTFKIRELMEKLSDTEIQDIVISIENEDLLIEFIKYVRDYMSESQMENCINMEDLQIKTQLLIIDLLPENLQTKYLEKFSMNVDIFNDEEKRVHFAYSSELLKNIVIESMTDGKCVEEMITTLSQENQYEYIKKHSSELNREFINNILIELLINPKIAEKILFEDKTKLDNITNIQIHQKLGKEFIEQHLEELIKYEFSTDKDEDIEDIIKNFYELENGVGNRIYKQIDFKILGSKYIEYLGIDSIIDIAKNDNLQNYLLNLEEGKLKVLSKCLGNNPYKNDENDYKIFIEKILTTLSKEDFSNLINGIDDINSLTDEDIKLLQQVLQRDNIFELKDLKDLRNYEELKRQKCDEWINSEDINIKRKAVLEKIFGQDWYYSKYYDVENLQNENIKKYIQCIYKIQSIKDPKILENIYYKCSEQIKVDEITIKKDIRSEYGKLFNNGLFRIEDAQKIKGQDNIYEAGTDFKMIIHSRARVRDDEKFQDYYEDWNRSRKYMKFADYFCASYIRNDMISGVSITDFVTYGFSSLEPSSLCGCSRGDGAALSTSSDKYCEPNYIINREDKRAFDNNNLYNELDYKLYSNGKKQQPDYIVVFRVNGLIKNWNEALKAQKDWKGKLPIVIVDVNKCIEAEKNKLEDMKAEFEKTKSPILARQIYHKIINNRHTVRFFNELKNPLKEPFFEDELLDDYIVSDEEIEKYMEEHKEEETNISPTMDRPKTKIETIYDQINTIISEKDTVEQDFKMDTQEEMEQVLQDEPQTIEPQIEITPKDIAKLDQARKITTTEVKRNPLIRLLDKAKEIKEKIIRGKKKDGR